MRALGIAFVLLWATTGLAHAEKVKTNQETRVVDHPGEQGKLGIPGDDAIDDDVGGKVPSHWIAGANAVVTGAASRWSSAVLSDERMEALEQVLGDGAGLAGAYRTTVAVDDGVVEVDRAHLAGAAR